jgi:hypothetical protein
VDIVTVIVKTIKESTLKHQLRWVKAHQDDNKPYEDLNIWGQMNCDEDGLAEKFRKLRDDGYVKPLKEGFFTNLMEVGILVDEVKVTSHLLHQICLKIQGSMHQKYLQDKHAWGDAAWNSLNRTGIKSGFL